LLCAARRPLIGRALVPLVVRVLTGKPCRHFARSRQAPIQAAVISRVPTTDRGGDLAVDVAQRVQRVAESDDDEASERAWWRDRFVLRMAASGVRLAVTLLGEYALASDAIATGLGPATIVVGGAHQVRGDLTFKNDETVSGIYCVTGNIKIQSRVTGTAVLLAIGKIATSGGDQHLSTAGPLGADLLMLAGSADSNAIGLQQKDASFAGAIVAIGGVTLGSTNSLYDGSLVGQSATLGGSNNTLDGR
jgi:hypothetical protein